MAGEGFVALGGASREGVARFARGTLGCACPDAVFQDVRREPGGVLAGLPLRCRIGIGGRLLLVVVDAAQPGLAAAMGDLYRAAREARDEGGFRRVRVVLLMGEGEPMAGGDLEQAFAAAAAGDPAAHLHRVPRRAGAVLCA